MRSVAWRSKHAHELDEVSAPAELERVGSRRDDENADKL
jgi:hypothetical protein